MFSHTPIRRRVIWQCRDKFKNKKRCATPHLTEDEIKLRFLKAFSLLFENREQLIEDCRIIQKTLTDTAEIDFELKRLLAEVNVVTELTRKDIEENSTVIQNQQDYTAVYDEYVKRYESLKSKIVSLQKTKTERQLKFNAIGAFMFEVMELSQPPIEFDEKLWVASIEKMTVYHDGRCVFKLKNGAEIEV